MSNVIKKEISLDLRALEKYEKFFEDGMRLFEVPDGEYRVQITDSIIKTSKKGDPQLIFVMTIQAGEHKGKRLYKFYTINSPESAAYLSSDVDLCGFDAESIQQVFMYHEEFRGVQLLIEKSQNENWQVIMLLELLEDNRTNSGTMACRSIL